MSLKALVIGDGEIGHPIYEKLRHTYGDKVMVRDLVFHGEYSFDFLHICFPQGKNWFAEVYKYVELYDPKAVIIHSTTVPGTVKQMNREYKPMFYFNPVRGNIKDGMMNGLDQYTSFLSVVDDHELDTKVTEHLLSVGFKVKPVESSTSLEYAKIINLSYYGMCIAFFQEIERIFENNTDLSYHIVEEFIKTTETESNGKHSRHLYYGGHIGGHCVIPGMQKLFDLHGIDMIQAGLLSNKLRKKEKDPQL